MGVAVFVVDTICSSSGSLGRCDTWGPMAGGHRPPCSDELPEGTTSGVALPARKPELLGLSLHVLVVELGTLLRTADAGADLNEDLLEVRALDRGEELQCQARLSVGLILRLIGHQRRGIAWHRARADRIRTRWK